MAVYIFFYQQNSMCGVTGDDFLVFPAKVMIYLILMENHFLEVKKTSNLLIYEL